MDLRFGLFCVGSEKEILCQDFGSVRFQVLLQWT